jgi:hypothetical protein
MLGVDSCCNTDGWFVVSVSRLEPEETQMEYEIRRGAELLERTPGTLESLLGGLSEEWLTASEGPDTWTPWDVLAHLTDLERTDWILRARLILEHGTDRPFDDIDRIAFHTRLAGRTMELLLKEFAELRRENLEALGALDLGPSQMTLPGTHPSLGRVTLSELLAAWVVHDLSHIAQIVRVLAKQYDSAAGPWKEYLGILNR